MESLPIEEFPSGFSAKVTQAIKDQKAFNKDPLGPLGEALDFTESKKMWVQAIDPFNNAFTEYTKLLDEEKKGKPVDATLKQRQIDIMQESVEKMIRVLRRPSSYEWRIELIKMNAQLGQIGLEKK